MNQMYIIHTIQKNKILAHYSIMIKQQESNNKLSILITIRIIKYLVQLDQLQEFILVFGLDKMLKMVRWSSTNSLHLASSPCT